jgi:hypothetical protein
VEGEEQPFKVGGKDIPQVTSKGITTMADSMAVSWGRG